MKVCGSACRRREMFWTIMSTLTFASASGPKDRRRARPPPDAAQRDLASSLSRQFRLRPALPRFHPRRKRWFRVHRRTAFGASGRRKLDGTRYVPNVPSRVLRNESEAPSHQAMPFQAFLRTDFDSSARFRHNGRIGCVDAIHIGVDVATVGVHRCGDRDGTGIGVATSKRCDAVVRAMPWKPVMTATCPRRARSRRH